MSVPAATPVLNNTPFVARRVATMTLEGGADLTGHQIRMDPALFSVPNPNTSSGDLRCGSSGDSWTVYVLYIALPSPLPQRHRPKNTPMRVHICKYAFGT